MRDGVNILHVHILRHVETDWCVIQDRLYPSLYKLIRNFLRNICRNCNHGNFDLMLSYFFSQRGCIINFKLANLLPNFLGVVIKYHFHAETAVCKPLVMGQRVSDIAHANDDHLPDPVNLEDVAQALNKERD